MRLLLLLLLASPLAAAPVAPNVAFNHLRVYEGWRLKPYRDGNGWSVGLGHSLTSHHEPVKPTYTDAECRALFTRDLETSRRGCRAAFKGFDDLPADVQLVCISLQWCVGNAGLIRFEQFRFAINHRMWNGAAMELAQSRFARQVSRDRLAAMVRVLRAQ